MIESETEASLILKDLESINSDIANLERFLIKEDEKLSEALCRIIADIFWRIEHPIIREYPSLCSLAAIGERYKECTYRIVRSDRSTFTCSVLESKIPPEDAARILFEIENRYPENQNVRFLLEVESCIPPQGLFVLNGALDMIESKIKAAFVMKQLERIRPEIEAQVARLKKEDMKLAEVLCMTLGTILVDIDYPILKVYPSLRPVDILGEKYKNFKYCIVRYNKSSGSNDIVESGIRPEDAARVLAEIENRFPKDQDSFFSMELEACPPSADK